MSRLSRSFALPAAQFSQMDLLASRVSGVLHHRYENETLQWANLHILGEGFAERFRSDRRSDQAAKCEFHEGPLEGIPHRSSYLICSNSRSFSASPSEGC